MSDLTCKDCIHENVCKRWAEMFHVNSNLIDRCDMLEPRDKYIELIPAHWEKHEPDPATMKAFHAAGLGKGMSENSIYWTCSHCGKWGTPIHSYCSNCGSRMKPFE